MSIDKFKFDGDQVTVGFSNIFESFRISTNDEPKSELFAAARMVVHQALFLFGLENVRASLACIEFSNGDDAGTKVLLKIPTMTGDYAKLQCPKVSSRDVVDHETGERSETPQNAFNDAVDEFIVQAEEFVRGKRQQMSLPFGGDMDAGEPVVNERMERSVADRITAFPR